MTRVRLLRSAEQDLDSLAHVRAIRDVAIVCEDRPAQSEWALIASAAARLWGRRRYDGVLVTIGDAALCAAAAAPRRRMIHAPVGTPTLRETMLLATRLTQARVVVATRAARATLIRRGVSSSRIEIVANASERPTVARGEARAMLGVDGDDTTLVHLPGSVRHDSGHRLALWACAILSYAEPSWRIVVSPRGDHGHADRFIRSTAPSGTVRVARGVDEATLAAAADVAMFCASGAPERAAIEAALTLGTAIVAPTALWRRERLPAADGVHLFAERKPRAVTRAALDAAATGVRRREVTNAWAGTTSWAAILRDFA